MNSNLIKTLKKDCFILMAAFDNVMIQKIDKSFVNIRTNPIEVNILISKVKRDLGFLEVEQNKPGQCLINPSVVKYFRYVQYLELGVVNCEVFFGRCESDFFIREFADILDQHFSNKRIADRIVESGTLRDNPMLR